MELVTVAHDRSVAVLRLHDPERRNVLSQEMVAAVGEAVDEIESDESARCLVVTGDGPAFCAGAELSALLQAGRGDFDAVRAVYDGFLRILRSPLLTIAAVNGAAVGAGLNLALACDIRLASEQAFFDTRFARLRLHPGGGHMWLLQRAVGYQQAALACLLSHTWDARQAEAVGLVASVHPGDDLIQAAVTLGAALEGQDAAFTRRMLETFRAEYSEPSHRDAMAMETTAQEWSTTQPGFVSAVAAIEGAVAARRRSTSR